MKNQFELLVDSLKETILPYDFYVNWSKIELKIKDVEKYLNTLNYLIGKTNIEIEFKELISEQPKIISALPILLAIRDSNKISILKEDDIIARYNFGLTNLSTEEIDSLYEFFKNTGLQDLFVKERVKNLVDYVFGIEVGMDTNGRKNRTGVLMENLVEQHLNKLNKERFSFISQATKDTIKVSFSIDLQIDKSSRRFDFAVFDNITKKLFLIEVNFYSGGGSKLKSTAGEYKEVYDFFEKQGFKFIWITDGLGWLKTKKPLESTFNHNNGQILNLKMLSEGELERMILSE